jgi:hypothetical protein
LTPFERIVVKRPTEPPCPAASLIAEAAGGTGCACRITSNLIDSRHDPSTLAAYCFNSDGYQQCPTWRADREELWRSKTIRPLLNRRGDLTAGHPEDRERNDGLALALDAQERDQWESSQQDRPTQAST